MTLPNPVRGPSSDRAARRLRVLICPSDTAYDYELAKLPHDLFVLGNTHAQWDSATRPLPENIRVTYALEDAGADILILSIDQWSFDQIEQRSLFLSLRDRFRGPKIIVNHGCNMVDGCSSEIMRELVGRNIMVSRTATAAELWSVERSRVVRMGLTAAEWPQTDYGRGNVVVLQPWDHGQFYNVPAMANLARLDTKVSRVGGARTLGNFDAYRSLLSSSSIYFNPSYAAPCPQAMVEAQSCGLAVVTTDRHGESSYIVNGENGFASNDMDELYAHVQFLYDHPNDVHRIGTAGRRTAQQIFSSERFIAEWEALLVEAVSGAKLSAIAGGAGE